MLVRQILKGKGDDAVVTIAPQASIADAVALLAERRIGAVVVSEDGLHPLGILSERDIVRALARVGGECLSGKVEALMTRQLVSCTREDPAQTVVERMTAGRFRHMPVLEGEEMVGLISIGDVVAARLSELAMERDALQDMVMGH